MDTPCFAGWQLVIVEQDDSQVSSSLLLSLMSVLCSGHFPFLGLQEVGLANLFRLRFHNIFHVAQCICSFDLHLFVPLTDKIIRTFLVCVLHFASSLFSCSMFMTVCPKHVNSNKCAFLNCYITVFNWSV